MANQTISGRFRKQGIYFFAETPQKNVAEPEDPPGERLNTRWTQI